MPTKHLNNLLILILFEPKHLLFLRFLHLILPIHPIPIIPLLHILMISFPPQRIIILRISTLIILPLVLILPLRLLFRLSVTAKPVMFFIHLSKSCNRPF